MVASIDSSAMHADIFPGVSWYTEGFLSFGDLQKMLHFAPEPRERDLAQETGACYSTTGRVPLVKISVRKYFT